MTCYKTCGDRYLVTTEANMYQTVDNKINIENYYRILMVKTWVM